MKSYATRPYRQNKSIHHTSSRRKLSTSRGAGAVPPVSSRKLRSKSTTSTTTTSGTNISATHTPLTPKQTQDHEFLQNIMSHAPEHAAPYFNSSQSTFLSPRQFVQSTAEFRQGTIVTLAKRKVLPSLHKANNMGTILLESMDSSTANDAPIGHPESQYHHHIGPSWNASNDDDTAVSPQVHSILTEEEIFTLTQAIKNPLDSNTGVSKDVNLTRGSPFAEHIRHLYPVTDFSGGIAPFSDDELRTFFRRRPRFLNFVTENNPHGFDLSILHRMVFMTPIERQNLVKHEIKHRVWQLLSHREQNRSPQMNTRMKVHRSFNPRATVFKVPPSSRINKSLLQPTTGRKKKSEFDGINGEISKEDHTKLQIMKGLQLKLGHAFAGIAKKLESSGVSPAEIQKLQTLLKRKQRTKKGVNELLNSLLKNISMVPPQPPQITTSGSSSQGTPENNNPDMDVNQSVTEFIDLFRELEKLEGKNEDFNTRVSKVQPVLMGVLSNLEDPDRLLKAKLHASALNTQVDHTTGEVVYNLIADDDGAKSDPNGDDASSPKKTKALQFGDRYSVMLALHDKMAKTVITDKEVELLRAMDEEKESKQYNDILQKLSALETTTVQSPKNLDTKLSLHLTQSFPAISHSSQNTPKYKDYKLSGNVAALARSLGVSVPQANIKMTLTRRKAAATLSDDDFPSPKQSRKSTEDLFMLQQKPAKTTRSKLPVPPVQLIMNVLPEDTHDDPVQGIGKKGNQSEQGDHQTLSESIARSGFNSLTYSPAILMSSIPQGSKGRKKRSMTEVMIDQPSSYRTAIATESTIGIKHTIANIGDTTEILKDPTNTSEAANELGCPVLEVLKEPKTSRTKSEKAKKEPKTSKEPKIAKEKKSKQPKILQKSKEKTLKLPKLAKSVKFEVQKYVSSDGLPPMKSFGFKSTEEARRDRLSPSSIDNDDSFVIADMKYTPDTPLNVEKVPQTRQNTGKPHQKSDKTKKNQQKLTDKSQESSTPKKVSKWSKMKEAAAQRRSETKTNNGLLYTKSHFELDLGPLQFFATRGAVNISDPEPTDPNTPTLDTTKM